MITVEAALLLPFLLILLFLLYSLCIIQFQNVVTRTEAMRTASRLAFHFTVSGGSGTTIFSDGVSSGKEICDSFDYTEHDPYRNFLELFGTGSQKTENAKDFLKRRMKEVPDIGMKITLDTTSSVESDAGYHIFNRYIKVTVDNQFHNPIEQLLSQYGYSIKNQYSVTAKARLTEPAEFIRTITFLEEQLKK